MGRLDINFQLFRFVYSFVFVLELNRISWGVRYIYKYILIFLNTGIDWNGGMSGMAVFTFYSLPLPDDCVMVYMV